MKTLQAIDLYLWRHLIPDLNPAIFRAKIASFFAIIYISFFPLPRKFIHHYFRGKGKALTLDTRKTIIENPQVYDRVMASINEDQKSGLHTNVLNIPQIYVNNPNYKYALGSFSVFYWLDEDIVNIKIDTNYHYVKDINRITHHLHNLLYSYKEKGRANDFDVEGNTWTIDFSKLSSVKVNNSIRKYVDLNRLYL